MKKFIAYFVFLSVLTSCNVTETIVITEDDLGEFLMSYDMGEMITQMKSQMGGGSDDSEKKEKSKVMETTIVFAELMEIFKDSISALPKNKQQDF